MEMGRGRRVPEGILVEILARLPLRSITRSKSVCKGWKSIMESSYFRRLFVSLHRNSSSSWSLVFPSENGNHIKEAIAFHGCETWDLPKSLCSYIKPFQRFLNLPTFKYYYIDSSNGLIWIEVYITVLFTVGTSKLQHRRVDSKTFVGNPILQQWVEIPPPPEQCEVTALVTRVEEDGVVSSFKVIRSCRNSDRETCEWRAYVYSSETGKWSFKRLVSSHPINYAGFYAPVNIDGMLYLWERALGDTHSGVLVAHDFHGPQADDQCRVIPLPLPYNKHTRRCVSTSGGDVIYIETLDGRLKVWKLKSDNSDGEWWHLSADEINLASLGFDLNCIPMGMNPFDADIVYLWSRQHSCLVFGNLKTQEFIVHQESESWSNSEGCWRISMSDSKKYMDANRLVVRLSQYVLPQWMDSVPRPPN